MAEQVFKDVGCGGPGHDNHGTDGDGLQDQSKTLVLAIPGHALSMHAEVAQVVDRNLAHRCRRLEGHVLSRLESLLLADHLAYFLIKPFRFDTGAHTLNRVCPYPVYRVPAVAPLLHLVDDGLAGLVLVTAIAKLDRHLAVLLTLEQPDAGNIVGCDAERIGNRRPFALSDAVGEAAASGVFGGRGFCGGS